MFAGFDDSDDEGSGDDAADPMQAALGLVRTFEEAEALEEQLEDEDAQHPRKRRAKKQKSRSTEHGENESGSGSEDKEQDDVQALSHNAADELEKAKAVQTQHGVLDGLFSVGMREQRALNLANRLPRHNTMPLFRAANPEAAIALDGVCSSLCEVIDDLMRLQGCLLAQSEATCKYLSVNDAERQLMREGKVGAMPDERAGDGRGTLNKRKMQSGSSEDEDEDEEHRPTEDSFSVDAVTTVADLWKAPGGIEALWSRIEKAQKRCEPYETDTLERWSRRTQLASRISQNKFKALNKSLTQQVQDVLRDRERLISRTTLKRIPYRVLGTQKRARTNEQQANARVYDSEIFDDLDFYQQLVKRQLTESSDSSDPFALGQAYIKSREEHYKQRKEVDRKANKMKKVSFAIHDKLVNFLAPNHRLSTPDYVDQLYANLFR